MSKKKDIERAIASVPFPDKGQLDQTLVDEAIYDAGVIAGLRLAARLDHRLRQRASGHTGDWEDGHDLHQEICRSEAKRRARRK